MKHVITIKEGEFELTTAEARTLYAELKELFESPPPQIHKTATGHGIAASISNCPPSVFTPIWQIDPKGTQV